METKRLSLCERIEALWDALRVLSQRVKASEQKVALLNERLERLESVVQRNCGTKPLSD